MFSVLSLLIKKYCSCPIHVLTLFPASSPTYISAPSPAPVPATALAPTTAPVPQHVPCRLLTLVLKPFVPLHSILIVQNIRQILGCFDK